MPITKSRVVLVFFLFLVLGGGILIGTLTPPGSWFISLQKPDFNPPGWVFAPVWTILYILISLAGWRVWQASPNSTPMILWWVQLVLNFSWSPVFFYANRMDIALVIILALFLDIALFIAKAWQIDRTASLLFVPYLAWVGFASVLNFALLQLN